MINHNDLFIGVEGAIRCGLDSPAEVRNKMMRHLIVMRLHYCLKVDG